MSSKDRQELAFILGQIVGILNTVPGVPTDKLESLMETVSAFTKKGISE